MFHREIYCLGSATDIFHRTRKNENKRKEIVKLVNDEVVVVVEVRRNRRGSGGTFEDKKK